MHSQFMQINFMHMHFTLRVYLISQSVQWACSRRPDALRMLLFQLLAIMHGKASQPGMVGGLVPRSCCSRAVMTDTASWTIIRRVIGWPEPVCAAIICPSSLMASFMSFTRNLTQPTNQCTTTTHIQSLPALCQPPKNCHRSHSNNFWLTIVSAKESTSPSAYRCNGDVCGICQKGFGKFRPLQCQHKDQNNTMGLQNLWCLPD